MIRLSTLDRLRIGAWNGSSFALDQLGRRDEGCAVAMKSIQLVKNAHTLSAFAINAVGAGRITEARETITELLKLRPGFRTSHVREAFPLRDLAGREQITAALRDAGLPD
jgi:adenylate cyclase